jgi:hypothetical protein
MAQGDLRLEDNVVKELMLEMHSSEAPLTLNRKARGKYPSHWKEMLGGSDGPLA